MSFQTKLRHNLKKPKSLLETLMIAGMNKDGTYRYDHDPQSELWRTTGEQGPIKINPKMQQRIDKLKSTFPWNQVQVDYGKPTELDKYFQEHGYPSRKDSDEHRLKIMRGSLKAKVSPRNKKAPGPNA